MSGRFAVFFLVYLLTFISFIGAQFSELVRDYREAEGDPVSPRKFQQACGLLFRDEIDRPLNGDTSQDTAQFINELLKRLDDEEIVERTNTADAKKPSVIQELFHVETGTNVSPHCCKSTCSQN